MSDKARVTITTRNGHRLRVFNLSSENTLELDKLISETVEKSRGMFDDSYTFINRDNSQPRITHFKREG